jgi:hypothetical protein
LKDQISEYATMPHTHQNGRTIRGFIIFVFVLE